MNHKQRQQRVSGLLGQGNRCRGLALVVAALAWMVNLAATGAVCAATAAQRPNIVFIIADDLGWADVAFHGGNAATPKAALNIPYAVPRRRSGTRSATSAVDAPRNAP